MSTVKDDYDLPKGIEIHGNNIRIVFMLDGKRMREPLPGVAKINNNSIKYAANKRAVILNEIKEGKFDYLHHFPDSKRGLALSGSGPIVNRTVTEGVKSWLSVCEAKKSTSSYATYRRRSKYVTDQWPERKIASIKKSEIEVFQSNLLLSGLNPKTVNDIFTVVRAVWVEAFHDEVIKANPLERIRNINRDHVETADPLTREEIALIEKADIKPQEKNMFLFDIWVGLSISELCGLAWEDVDTINWTLTIRRARVEAEYKVPKEQCRIRVVELVAPAIEYLKSQMAYSAHLPAHEITVKQRDNISEKVEFVRFVFWNEYQTQRQPWHYSSTLRRFGELLRVAGVRHRGPNQCRHTFASQCLTHYIPLEWLARQLGHSDTTMIKKHYGKFIPSDTPSMAGWVSKKLGF